MKNIKQKKRSKKESLLEMMLAVIIMFVPAAPMNDTDLEIPFILFGLLMGGLFIFLGFLHKYYGLIICACIGIAIAIMKIYGGYGSFAHFIELLF